MMPPMTEENEEKTEVERNLGEQPIAALMLRHGLAPHDLVAASLVPMNHKMVSRAVKGRKLTIRTKLIVLNAINRAAGTHYLMVDLFTY